jgi:hypothetical protein
MTTSVEKSSNQIHANPSFLLDELKAAHANLLRAIEEIDQLTRGPVPSRELLDSIRWRLSKASLSRRLLWGKILCVLSPIVGESIRAELRHLQETDIQLLRDSTQHVAKWTTENIIDDWPAYCRASERMRSKMGDAVAEEKRTLYPILAA